MYKALHLSPMVPSFNIEETSYFLQNVLDFKVGMNESTYAILHKDNLTVHLLRAGKDIGQMEFYLEVDDIEQVWDRIKGKLEGVAHKAPFDRDYGMREIHIAVPQTNALMFIGQSLR